MNLVPVEAAEPVTEVASKESRDAGSSESITTMHKCKCKSMNGNLITTNLKAEGEQYQKLVYKHVL